MFSKSGNTDISNRGTKKIDCAAIYRYGSPQYICFQMDLQAILNSLNNQNKFRHIPALLHPFAIYRFSILHACQVVVKNIFETS